MNNDRIEVRCPHCGASYRVNSDHVGRRVKCAKCQQEFRAFAQGPVQHNPAVTATPPALPSQSNSFAVWYRDRPGKWHVALQALAWFFYGFIWIPLWYLYTRGQNRLVWVIGVVAFLALGIVGSVRNDRGNPIDDRDDSIAPAIVEGPESSLIVNDVQFPITVDSTHLTDAARHFFETGPDMRFDPTNAGRTGGWAGLRLRQQQLASETGNKIVADEVRNAIEAELAQIVGTPVSWHAMVDHVRSDRIRFYPKAVFTTQNGAATLLNEILIYSRSDRGELAINIDSEELRQRAAQLKNKDVIAIEGVVAKCAMDGASLFRIDLRDLMLR
jgi:predicted Zn finger-like uncharacterized protein